MIAIDKDMYIVFLKDIKKRKESSKFCESPYTVSLDYLLSHLSEFYIEIPDKDENKLPELKPCPFCGSKEISFVDGNFAKYFFCNRFGESCCLARSGGTKLEAIQLWNTRA